MMRRFLASVVLIAITGGFVAVPASADDKGGGGGVAADPCNSRLAVQVGSDGRFNMGAFPDPATCGATTGSWDIMFRWPESPWSSFSTLRIDGADNVYGSSGSQLEAPNDIDAVTNRSEWQIGDIEVTQTLQIVLNNQTGQEDVAKVAYTVRNTGSSSHDVGLRTMIDTELNLNDGAPFRVPGVGIVTRESEFTGAAVPDTFQAFFDLTDSEHVTSSTLKSGGATAPDRLVLANWHHLYNTNYDYTIDPTFDFTDPAVARPDSAYAVYWNPTSLAPGDSRTYVTFYGLAELEVVLLPPPALGVTGPASLSVVDGAYSPNPFDIVATVFNNGSATITDVELTLSLPAGLSLAAGSATQSIGDLAVGQERQVSWSVLAAAQSSETTLTYRVTATASNAEPKTVDRQITLPPLVAPGFSFAIITDLHIGRYPEYDGEEYYLTQRLKNVVRWLKENWCATWLDSQCVARNFDFVVVLGDISNGEDVSGEDHKRQLDKAKTILEELEKDTDPRTGEPVLRYIPLIGNHDVDKVGGKGYFRDVFAAQFAELEEFFGTADWDRTGGSSPIVAFAFNYRRGGAAAKFIALDFTKEGSALATNIDENVAWLNERLAEAQGVPVVVMAHHPLPDPRGATACFGFSPRKNAQKVWDAIFAGAAGSSVAIFGGHVHGFYPMAPWERAWLAWCGKRLTSVFDANNVTVVEHNSVRIPSVVTEATMVGSNQPGKGFVRIVRVEGRAIRYEQIEGDFLPALNPGMSCSMVLRRFWRHTIECEGSRYADRQVSSWVWDFNSDGVPDRTGQKVSYTYEAGGEKKVCLTVVGESAQERICELWAVR